MANNQRGMQMEGQIHQGRRLDWGTARGCDRQWIGGEQKRPWGWKCSEIDWVATTVLEGLATPETIGKEEKVREWPWQNSPGWSKLKSKLDLARRRESHACHLQYCLGHGSADGRASRSVNLCPINMNFQWHHLDSRQLTHHLSLQKHLWRPGRVFLKPGQGQDHHLSYSGLVTLNPIFTSLHCILILNERQRQILLSSPYKVQRQWGLEKSGDLPTTM